MTVAPPMHKVYNYRMNKELEYTKMKVGSLISLRQSLMAVLTVLVGGVVGLSFMQNSSVKTLYVILGWFFLPRDKRVTVKAQRLDFHSLLGRATS